MGHSEGYNCTPRMNLPFAIYYSFVDNSTHVVNRRLECSCNRPAARAREMGG